MENPQRAIVAAVEARMRSAEAAERLADPEQMLAHFASGPDVYFYNDGQRWTYAALAAGLRSSGFRSLKGLIEPGFGDLHVWVLGAEYALVTAKFKRTVTDSSGAVTRSQGALSWLWRNIDGQWLIVYGQTDHRPDSGA